MTRAFRRWLPTLVFLAVIGLLVPGLAAAQYRQFSGKVDNKGKDGLIVDNRQGDKLKFMTGDYTKVEGEKASLDAVQRGDWVTVDWKLMDKPRKAYTIKVLPPKEGEE